MVKFTFLPALLLLLFLPIFAWIGGRGAERRERLGLILRLVIVACLVLALAGLEILRPDRSLAVVFLLDRSDSMSPTAKDQALQTVRSALQSMGPDDQAAVVAFGAQALVERGMSAERQMGPVLSKPRADGTDIGAALRLGLALFPPGSARRIVLLSDGLDTAGEPALDAAAALAHASAVQLLAAPFSSPSGLEVALQTVSAPSRLAQGERFDLRLEVSATQPQRAGVRVLSGGQVVYQGTLDLGRGVQTFNLPLQAGEPGFSRFQVQIDPLQDSAYQNNELTAFATVSGPPRVLLVSMPPGDRLPGGLPRPDEAVQLRAALQATGMQIESAPPAGLPSSLPGLASYAAVALVDVPARALNPRQMAALQGYVRDLGGGLLAVGGPTSFGLGGYYRTPLETTLPVEMQIKDVRRRPTLALVFIIDHSGSMSEVSGGEVKLELAKEAVLRSLDLLTPVDHVGVVAFDDFAAWVAPVAELGDGQAVRNGIETLRPDGGTDILAGVQAMASVLPNDPAMVKHVILLTDGGADPTGIPQLVQELHDKHGITLSTVGVGSDAAPYLPSLAELGGGRYHFAADSSAIPTIFTEETSLATRAYLVENPFTPLLAAPSPILSGIDQLPQLLGYVATVPKAAAQTVLVSDQGDPILAVWQYGLGQAAAFTSDATARWASQWVGWSGFSRFWGQALSAILRRETPIALEARVEQPQGEAGPAQLVVETQDENGAFLNGYRFQARLAGPDGQPRDLDLQQVAPGRYTAQFDAAQPGAYLVGVQGHSADGKETLSAASGWARAYSPEYRTLQGDPQALAKAVALADGRLIQGETADAAAQIFRHDLPGGLQTRPAWPFLLLLAIWLLPLDIAVRRLALTPADIWRSVARWMRQAGTLRQKAADGGPRDARVEGLLRAKQRAARPLSPPFASLPVKTPPLPPETPKRSATEEPATAQPDRPELGHKMTDRPPASSPPREDGAPSSTAASLLDHKRRKQK